jgi:hypothetical protein
MKVKMSKRGYKKLLEVSEFIELVEKVCLAHYRHTQNPTDTNYRKLLTKKRNLLKWVLKIKHFVENGNKNI